MRTNIYFSSWHIAFALTTGLVTACGGPESKRNGPPVTVTVVVDAKSTGSRHVSIAVEGVGYPVIKTCPQLDGVVTCLKRITIPNRYYAGDTVHVRVYKELCMEDCTLVNADFPVNIGGVQGKYSTPAGQATVSVIVQ